jgi:multisubunit Na+/H+ antiporter MnhC subunit
MDVTMGPFYLAFTILCLILLGIYAILHRYVITGQNSTWYLALFAITFINIALSIQAFAVSLIAYYNTQKAISDFNSVINNQQ